MEKLQFLPQNSDPQSTLGRSEPLPDARDRDSDLVGIMRQTMTLHCANVDDSVAKAVYVHALPEAQAVIHCKGGAKVGVNAWDRWGARLSTSFLLSTSPDKGSLLGMQ